MVAWSNRAPYTLGISEIALECPHRLEALESMFDGIKFWVGPPNGFFINVNKLI